MKEFGLSTLDDTPTADCFSEENFLVKPPLERRNIFIKAVKDLLHKYTYAFEVDMPQSIKEADGVLAYAKELLSLGLLYMEYCDSIREGDGLRILRCWRYMLLLFKAKNKRKYAIQAATMLFQYHFLLSERMKHQLLWSRTINIHGKLGKNIPMDLHNEHLNRQLKEALGHLASNVNDVTIQRVGRCLSKLMIIKANYDETSEIKPQYGRHSRKSLTKDLASLVEHLNKSEIFNNITGRQHSQFPKFATCTSHIKKSDINVWLEKQLRNLIIYQ
jgi:L1 cell adhesion molecule like protein